MCKSCKTQIYSCVWLVPNPYDKEKLFIPNFQYDILKWSQKEASVQ